MVISASQLACGLLAASSPDPEFVGQWVLALGAFSVFISIALSSLSVWAAFRRKPPLAEEAYRVFIPRSEYLDAITRIHSRIELTNDNLAKSNAMMAKACADLERAIGKLEGKIENTSFYSKGGK